MALHQVTALNDAEDRILEALPRLAQPRRNNMTSSAGQRLHRRHRPAPAVCLDDAVSRAVRCAEDGGRSHAQLPRTAAGWTPIALFIPYHYFPRGGLTWLRRMWRKPSTANMYPRHPEGHRHRTGRQGAGRKGDPDLGRFADGGQLRVSNPAQQHDAVQYVRAPTPSRHRKATPTQNGPGPRSRT